VFRKFNAAKFNSDVADQCKQMLLQTGDGRRNNRVEQFTEPRLSTII